MGPTTTQQVMIPDAAICWYIVAIGLLFIGIGVVILRLADQDAPPIKGLGFIVGGLGIVTSTTGLHLTPSSSPLDWLWVGVLVAAGAVMGICLYLRPIEDRLLAIATACGQWSRARGNG